MYNVLIIRVIVCLYENIFISVEFQDMLHNIFKNLHKRA